MEAKVGSKPKPKLKLNVEPELSETKSDCCKHPTQVKQLVRTIGAADTMESQSVVRVDARISELLKEGWTLHTAQALAAGVGGAVTVYYMLVK